MLRTALSEADYGALFRITETFRAGAEGQEKTAALLASLRGLLRDLMLLKEGQAAMVRNQDLGRELARMAESLTFRWVESAVHALDEVETGMRRNLLRALSLDAMTGRLSRAGTSRNDLSMLERSS